METINSIKDSRIVAARKLAHASQRQKACLLEGEAIISWALAANINIQHVFVSNDYINDDLLVVLAERNILIYQCSSGIMRKINNSKYLIPIIGVGQLPRQALKANSSLLLILDNLYDQGNIGTIIRTAAAFGINDIVTVGKSADLYNKKTITASRGTVFQIRHQVNTDPLATVKQFQSLGYQVLAMSPRGQQLQSLTQLADKPVALMVGNETHGLTEDVLTQADLTIQIPMSDPVESLNVGVATGISLYELKLKVILAMLTKNIRSTLGREIGVAHNLIRQVFDRELKKVCDYSSAQMILLMIMLCDEIMTKEQIIKDIGCYGKELEDLIQPLLSNEFIAVTSDKKGFYVTSKGEEMLAKLWVVVEKSEAIILADFSDKEKSQLNNFIKRIQSNCEKLA